MIHSLIHIISEKLLRLWAAHFKLQSVCFGFMTLSHILAVSLFGSPTIQLHFMFKTHILYQQSLLLQTTRFFQGNKIMMRFSNQLFLFVCFVLGCSSARFEGSLNVDLNEIAMNLVPFPRLHYLVPSLTPLYTLADVNAVPRRSADLLHRVVAFSCCRFVVYLRRHLFM